MNSGLECCLDAVCFSIAQFQVYERAGVHEADVAGFVAAGDQAESAAAVAYALAGAQEIVGIHFVAAGNSNPARSPVEPVAEADLPAQIPSPGVVRIIRPIDALAGDRRCGG